MTTLLDKIRETLEEGYDFFRDTATVAIDKAEDFGKISKMKFEIKQISSQTEKKLTILGDALYPYLLKNDVEALKNNAAIKTIVDEIQELNKKIENKQKEVDKVVSENEKIVKEKEEEKIQKNIEILEKEIEERMNVLNELKKEKK
jgi:predicted RNase H-like nuclease (RuvC/YqgF family)